MILFVLSLLVFLQPSDRAHGQQSVEVAQQVSLEKLSWMVGHWSGEKNGRVTEEFWMSPKAGTMLGINRVIAGSTKASFEFLRIAEVDGTITYHASPGGSESTAFKLKECNDFQAVFENLEHDFPQRVLYRRENDQLIGRIEGSFGGAQRSTEWHWTKSTQDDAEQAKSEDGERLFHGLRTVVYKVEDLRKAKDWYASVLGFPPYFDEAFYVGFNVGGYELGLDPDTESVTRGNNQPVYWGVDNCREAFGELLKKGATKHTPPQEVGGGIIVASVTDPFGNVLGVIQNPNFKAEKAD